jgi:hypothetical protein
VLLPTWLNVTNSFLSLALPGLARHLTDLCSQIRAEGMYFSNQCIWSFRGAGRSKLCSQETCQNGISDRRTIVVDYDWTVTEPTIFRGIILGKRSFVRWTDPSLSSAPRSAENDLRSAIAG